MSDNKTVACETVVKSMPQPVCEPAPLGIIGLVVAAFVLATIDMGWTGPSKVMLVPWALAMGATAQLIAGIMDFKRNNIFGATVFTTYGMLWAGVAGTLIVANWGGDAAKTADMAQYGYAILAFFFFSVIMTFAAAMANKVFLTILVLIDVALLATSLHWLHELDARIAGVFLLGVVAVSLYALASIMLNTMAGRTLLPMGAPLWKPNKA